MKTTPTMTRLGAVSLADVDPAPPRPLIVDRLDPNGHTIVFGPGGSGKGTLVASWIVRAVHAGRRVLIVDYEGHRDEWARRIGSLGDAEARDAVVHVEPLAFDWGGPKGPLWDATDDFNDLIFDAEINLIVVDSLALACLGADVISADAPARYAAALEDLALPVVSIAHVAKGGDGSLPYGSTHWHSYARATWSVSRDGDHAVLVNRKANRYRPLGQFRVDVTYSDDDTPVEVREEPIARPVIADRLNTDERVFLAIVDGASSADEVAERTGLSKRTAAYSIKRLREGGRVQPDRPLRPTASSIKCNAVQ